MSRVFVTRLFDKWASKQRALDAALAAAIDGADIGLVDANLKGCLIKLRVARQGEGKSSRYRTIVAYRTRDRAFFLYGFGKNDRANLTDQEAAGYEEYGQILLGLTERELAKEISESKLREIER